MDDASYHRPEQSNSPSPRSELAVGGKVDRLVTELRETLETIRGDIARLKQDEARIVRLLAAETKSRQPPRLKPGPKRGRKLGQSARQVVETYAREAMDEAGAPLSRDELLAGMEARGIELDSPAPATLVRKILWNSSTFTQIADGIWWLSGRDVPSEPR